MEVIAGSIQNFSKTLTWANRKIWMLPFQCWELDTGLADAGKVRSVLPWENVPAER